MAEVVEEARKSSGAAEQRPEDAPAPTAQLVCIEPSILPDDTAAVIDLYGDSLTIGRADGNSVSLKAEGVSRLHARLVWDEIAWVIEDNGSTNGVRVNRKKVSSQRLQPGDVVQLGRARFEFRPVDAKPDDVSDEIDNTVIIPPEADSLLEKPPSGPRLAPKAPHPRTEANVEPAPEPRRRTRTRRQESDRWQWWLVAGVIAILTVAYHLL